MVEGRKSVSSGSSCFEEIQPQSSLPSLPESTSPRQEWTNSLDVMVPPRTQNDAEYSDFQWDLIRSLQEERDMLREQSVQKDRMLQRCLGQLQKEQDSSRQYREYCQRLKARVVRLETEARLESFDDSKEVKNATQVEEESKGQQAEQNPVDSSSQKKPRKRNKKTKKARKEIEEDRFLEKTLRENEKWWLDTQLLENNEKIYHNCTKCDPTIWFNDEQAHRKHMQMIHGSSIYFRELSTEAKARSAESLELYMNGLEISRDQLGPPSCFCQVVLNPPQTNQLKFLLSLHDMIADHKPMQRCIQCGLVIFEELILIHLKHDCNDRAASTHFRDNPQSRNFGSLVFEGIKHLENLPPLSD